MRARCSVFIATSLDMFIARADGAIDWGVPTAPPLRRRPLMSAEGGINWLSIVQSGTEDYGYARFFESIDALVLGSKTYETALGFERWPYSGKRCIVMTSATRTPQHDEEFHSGDPRVVIDRLTSEGVRHVYVDGGTVVRDCLRPAGSVLTSFCQRLALRASTLAWAVRDCLRPAGSARPSANVSPFGLRLWHGRFVDSCRRGSSTT